MLHQLSVQLMQIKGAKSNKEESYEGLERSGPETIIGECWQDRMLLFCYYTRYPTAFPYYRF
jgi:hypothetical protein